MSDALDDLGFDEPVEETVDSASGSQPDAANQKRIEQALHRAEKQLKALETKNAELEAFRTEATQKERAAAVQAAFTELNLKPKQAELYSGEPDPEAIKQWAVDYGFVEIDGEVTSDEKNQGFVPGVQGGELPGPNTYTHTQIMEMLATDPAKADRLLSQGRVQLNKQD